MAWKTETRYQEDSNDETVAYVRYGPETPDARAELNTAYGFFETEAEAAAAFLEEIEEHPEARYNASVHQNALKAVEK